LRHESAGFPFQRLLPRIQFSEAADPFRCQSLRAQAINPFAPGLDQHLSARSVEIDGGEGSFQKRFPSILHGAEQTLAGGQINPSGGIQVQVMDEHLRDIGRLVPAAAAGQALVKPSLFRTQGQQAAVRQGLDLHDSRDIHWHLAARYPAILSLCRGRKGQSHDHQQYGKSFHRNIPCTDHSGGSAVR